ncbi:MAG: two-component system sensor histidine kinase CreC [Planctomycetota bacterium]|jgi:two-component system sensor histidine kinase CreC|nr:two-component system sensor histidine kinase CreC [Planctomycetota bacterium]
MSIRTRVLLACLLVSMAGLALQLRWTLGEVRLRYLEALEETMVDTAGVLAPHARAATGDLNPQALQVAWAAAREPGLDARIYDKHKQQIDLAAYLVDAHGIVVWDSEDPSRVGADYSQWNNIVRTLRGQYGARATPGASDDPLDAILHVSAPVGPRDAPIGVFTVVKAPSSLAPLERAATGQALLGAVVALGFTTAVMLVVGLWVTGPIAALTEHVSTLRQGERKAPPKLPAEIGELAAAITELHQELDGLSYVESYVQSLTHELKSPLSAIDAHAELLEDETDPAQRTAFIATLRDECNRMRALIERLLDHAALERRDSVSATSVALDDLIRASCAPLQPDCAQRAVTLQCELKSVQMDGDELLIGQAITNLLSNAISVAPANSMVQVTCHNDGALAVIRVCDHGPGVPDWAHARLGERFFRAPIEGRPRGHGLGLAQVAQVARLHHGNWRLFRQGNCTIAELRLQRHPS